MWPTVIPPEFARRAARTWGADGARWVGCLPSLVTTVARDWCLDVGATYPLSHHYVVAVTRADGSDAVLKLGVPGSSAVAAEVGALEIFGGRGAVRVLAHDAGRGAVLLERAAPGTPATTLVPDHDDVATAAAISVLRTLHVPPPPGCTLPELTTLGGAFTRYLHRHPQGGPLPGALVEHAGRLFRELCASASDRVVLHGDLHHDNVLRAEREPWLVIDPHGGVGDPGYDVGALLYNPDPGRHDERLLALLPARVEQLADGLRLPPERVVAWGFVKAVLAEVWTVEDGGTPGGRALDVALRLRPRLG